MGGTFFPTLKENCKIESIKEFIMSQIGLESQIKFLEADEEEVLLLNHLGDVYEELHFWYGNGLRTPYQEGRGGNIVTTCNQLEVVFYKKKLFCQSTVFIYGLACVMLSNIHVINALIKQFQERKMKREIIFVCLGLFFFKKS